MSTKKDNYSFKDYNFMKLALNLARARKGLTGDNPSVGCVIVKKGKIISIGQTSFDGRPHAEHNAISNCNQNLKGSKMYLTLEPCNHHGKTPPCTKKIIKNGISELYYSIDDIDKRVKGKSLKILTNKNIKVKKGLLHQEARDLYRSYFFNRLNKLPFVVGKIAISKNNLIYSENVKRITDKTSDKLTHFLRFKNDAILISVKTLNIDNPMLNCRLKGFEKFSPIRIVLDKNLEIELQSKIVKSAKRNNTIIFHNSSNNTKIKTLNIKKIKLIKQKLNNKNQFDLKKILKKLYILGIRNLIVEGGDKITKSFLKKKLMNEFYLFKSQKSLSKTKKHQIFTSNDILNNQYNTKPQIRSKLAKDSITIYKR
tara:strand:- start:580 stop:1686 length:1107 start_codon:yes stop_codon:yes gene_type:complete